MAGFAKGSQQFRYAQARQPTYSTQTPIELGIALSRPSPEPAPDLGPRFSERLPESVGHESLSRSRAGLGSGAERGDRDGLHAVGAAVGGTFGGDHHQSGQARRSLGGCLAREAQQGRRSTVDGLGAGIELGLSGDPSAVESLDDGIDLQTRVVAPPTRDCAF